MREKLLKCICCRASRTSSCGRGARVPRPQDLEQHGKPLSVVRSKVLNLLRGKILVGHALSNDLKCLDIAHPWYLQRDTAYYGPFMQRRERENGHSVSLPRKLRILTSERLGRQIQVPGKAHCPAEDATAALDLYKYERQQWELFLQQHLEEISRYQRLQQLQMQYEQQLYFQQQNLHRHHQPVFGIMQTQQQVCQ